MAGDNLTTGDGMLKDSYVSKKAITKQPAGFQRLAPFKKRIYGLSFTKYAGGVKK